MVDALYFRDGTYNSAKLRRELVRISSLTVGTRAWR
jgi:hypothetical protein